VARNQNRIIELDGIRGIAILLVLIWHYVACQIHAEHSGSVIIYYLGRALSLTKSGVDLFFVLSGFLIAGILLDNRDADNYFRVFYVRRICRIFPLYFLLFGLFLALTNLGLDKLSQFHWLFEKPLPLWSYATFTQNVSIGLRGDFGPHWLGITWSLAVEEQFYCFIPLLVWLLPRRIFVFVALLLVFLAPLLRALWGGLPAYVWTPWRGDSLLTGALLAVLVRDHRILDILRANISILYATFIGFLGGAAILTLRPDAFGAAYHTWLACLYGVFLLLAVVEPDTLIARILRNPALEWLGIMSYGLYMFHEALSGIVHGLLGNGIPSLNSAFGCTLTLISFILTIIVTTASFRFFERPFLKWGHRFRYRME
jgi:peptidoglycan/LPS O-acetylase OafA/YrhL